MGHIPRQVDWFHGHRWTGMEFDPIGPFTGHADPGVFKVWLSSELYDELLNWEMRDIKQWKL